MANDGYGTPDYSNVYVESLVSEYFWLTGSGPITYYLKPGDINANGTNDWDEQGAATAFRTATAAWAAVANITFQEVFEEAGANWVEELLDLGAGLLGQHYYPNDQGLGGEFNFNHGIFTAASNVPGGLSYTTFLHELGHGLGLDHPHELEPFPGVTSGDPWDLGDFNLNQGIWTTMTYNDGYDVLGASPSNNTGWQTGPMAFDIAAVQALYGANTSTNAGDTVHTIPTNGYTAIWDASGTDWIVAAGGESRNLRIDLRAATLLTANGGGGYLSNAAGVRAGFTIANTVVIENGRGGAGADTIVGNTANNRLEGMAGNDILIGGVGGDTLIGGDGTDTLLGQDGDDWMEGGTGAANTLQGGIGNDTYVTNTLGDTLYELAGEGTDEIRTSNSALVIQANIERLVYTGSASFVGVGNGLDNDITGGTQGDTLIGNQGNDTLRGGTGTPNTLLGGVGDDIYVVAASGDSIIELVGEGTDTIQTTLAVMTMAPNVENLTYTGVAAFAGIGNAIANTITGGTAGDTLLGRDGNDTLIGGTGTPNTLLGEGGDDTYIVATVGDSIIEQAGQGTDTVQTALAAHTLRDNVENLTYTGAASFAGVGNAGNNVITGGAMADTLLGRDGNDTLIGGTGAANTLLGGAGDDVYRVDTAGDSIVELVGEGTDAVFTTRAVFTLPGNVENLYNVGTTGFHGLGTGAANYMEGSTGDDVLTGGGGNDTLNGAGGIDFATYGDLRVNYTLVTGGSVTIQANGSSGEGTDTLIGIERLSFSNGEVVTIASPIVLDLDGDGIGFVAAGDSAITYDLDGNGQADDTSWIAAGDAFLFLDRDGNGTVSGIGEMSFVGDLAMAGSDLAGLAAFDSNGDGLLSEGDASFADFGVWTDGNANGVADAGEVASLLAAGIAGISLSGTAYAGSYAFGETAVVNTGQFLRTDGSFGALADVVLTTPGDVFPV